MRKLDEIERDLEQAVNEYKHASLRVGALLIEADEFFGRDKPRSGSSGKAGVPPFKEAFKQWAMNKTGLAWITCMSYMDAARKPGKFKESNAKNLSRKKEIHKIGVAGSEIFSPPKQSVFSAKERRERRIAFVVDAAFYLDDDEWDEAHALIIQRRSERRRSQRVAA